MRHISLVGNENYILIRFFVTWKIPLPCLTLQGPFWGMLIRRLPFSPCLGDIIYLISAHVGWHMVQTAKENGWWWGSPTDLLFKETKCILTSRFSVMGGVKDSSAGEAGGTVERLLQRLVIHLFTEKIRKVSLQRKNSHSNMLSHRPHRVLSHLTTVYKRWFNAF